MPRQGFSAPTLLGDMLLTMVEDLFTPLTTRQDLDELYKTRRTMAWPTPYTEAMAQKLTIRGNALVEHPRQISSPQHRIPL